MVSDVDVHEKIFINSCERHALEETGRDREEAWLQGGLSVCVDTKRGNGAQMK